MTTTSKEALVKRIDEAKATLEVLRTAATVAAKDADKAWNKRDRQAFKVAERERLGAEARVATQESAIARLEDVLADNARSERRKAVDAIAELVDDAIKAAYASPEVATVLAAEADWHGTVHSVSFRSSLDGEMRLNVDGALVSHTPTGPLFTRPTVGRPEGATRASSRGYRFVVDGVTMDAKAFLEAKGPQAVAFGAVGEAILAKTIEGVPGTNRQRLALRVGKAIGVPQMVEANRDPVAKRYRGARADEATPQAAFRPAIIEALAKAGGKASVRDVLGYIERQMGGTFTSLDLQRLASGPIRWKNRAEWERHQMVAEGLLRSDSPHGVWELTDEGWKEARKGSGVP